MISIVLPTYNEARSIQEVLCRASEALRKAEEDHELIVVDDSSPDRTADLAEALASKIPVRVLRRPGRQGLATAVVDGWSIARGEMLGVMDADLQHPPEVLTRLVSALRDKNVDVAIATRSGPGGGSAAEWRWMRRLTSWAARHLAACVLPRTLADLSDPMSGMFLIRARALQGVRLEPTGYKILLEVLGKAHYSELVEVPFVFQARSLGSSKLGMRESLQYLAHLGRLARSTGQLRSWIRYAAVGFTGAVVNVGVLAFLADRQCPPDRPGAPLGQKRQYADVHDRAGEAHRRVTDPAPQLTGGAGQPRQMRQVLRGLSHAKLGASQGSGLEHERDFHQFAVMSLAQDLEQDLITRGFKPDSLERPSADQKHSGHGVAEVGQRPGKHARRQVPRHP